MQVESLYEKVQRIAIKDPGGYRTKNSTKRLAAISKLAFDVIPQNPEAPQYRQGNTLGSEHKHWFRAKFYQQYRLFFRYHSKSKIIIYAWVNDEKCKRAYGSKTDAYLTFLRMLDSGHPPDNWGILLSEAKSETHRLGKVAQGWTQKHF